MKEKSLVVTNIMKKQGPKSCIDWSPGSYDEEANSKEPETRNGGMHPETAKPGNMEVERSMNQAVGE